MFTTFENFLTFCKKVKICRRHDGIHVQRHTRKYTVCYLYLICQKLIFKRIFKSHIRGVMIAKLHVANDLPAYKMHMQGQQV